MIRINLLSNRDDAGPIPVRVRSVHPGRAGLLAAFVRQCQAELAAEIFRPLPCTARIDRLTAAIRRNTVSLLLLPDGTVIYSSASLKKCDPQHLHRVLFLGEAA